MRSGSKTLCPPTAATPHTKPYLRDFRTRIPALEHELKQQGVPGVFLDLEPHLKGGGQFGGFSGVDGFGVALRALLNLLDYVGIGYALTDYEAIARQRD